MNFSHQNLQGKSFENRDLVGANFSHANIQGANFNNAKLTGANFSRAKCGVQFIWGIALVIAGLFLTTFINSIVARFVAFSLDYSIGKSAIFFVCYISLVSLGVFIYNTSRRNLLSGLLTAIATTVISTIILIIAIVIVPNFSSLISSGDHNFLFMGLMFAPSIITISILALAFVLALGIIVSGNVTTYGGIFLAIIAIPDTAMSVMSNVVGRSIHTQGNYEALVQIVAELDKMLISAFDNPEAQQLTLQNVIQIIPQILDLAKPGIEAAIAYAFFFVALPACILGVYIAWRTLAEDEQYEQIKNIALIPASLFGTRFRNANLTDANFTQAELKSTDLSNAALTRTCWQAAKQLHQARLNNTYLENSQIRKLVITGDGRNKDFDGLNLQGVNLENANLENASFNRANLAQANLRRANLAGALLIKTHLEEANLTKANLTDACIADWKITKNTQLDDIECQYIYFQFINGQKSNRLPNGERDFQPGEFSNLIQYLFDGFDLEHTEDINNINAKAVYLALQKLSIQYQDDIAVVGIQQKSNTIVFKIKNNNPNNIAKIKSEYPDKYKQAVNFLHQNQEVNFTESQIKDLQTALDRLETLIEKLDKSNTVYHYKKLIIPENSIFFVGNMENNKMLGDRNARVENGNYNERVERNYINATHVNIIENLGVTDKTCPPYQKTTEKSRLVFAITGSIDRVNQTKLKAITALLQQITGDTFIEIVDVQEGSIKLILEGNPESLKKIKELFESGELTEVENIPIEYVHFLKNQNHPIEQLSESQRNQIFQEKIQELKTIINLNSELIPADINLALEQIENLEQAAKNPQEQSGRKIFIKAIRIIRGIIHNSPKNNDYNELITYIHNLFKSSNITTNQSSLPANSQQNSPFVSIGEFNNNQGYASMGRDFTMNFDQRKLNVGRDLNATGANIMSDNANIINQLPTSTNPNQPGIKELLTELENAIADSPDLDNDDKEEAAENLEAIAEAALDPQDESKKKGLRRAIKFFQRTVGILPAGAALITICDRILPAISNWFSIGN